MNTTNDNATVLHTVKVNRDAVAWYGDILAKWPDNAGTKPTQAMLMVPHLIDGKRPGVEALHLAMCLRPHGCTVQQFLLAGSCGPANNYRRAMVKTGWFKCVTQGKPYAYVLTITEKGAAKLAKAQAEAEAQASGDRPAKAKRKAKGKGKGGEATQAPAVETPTSDHGNAVEPQASADAMKAQHEAADTATPQA